MILPIYTFGDERLKTVSKDFDLETEKDDIRILIDSMFETMYNANGIGLAAPQIGVHKRLVVIDVELGNDPNGIDSIHFKGAFINPKIIQQFGEIYQTTEGCLSIPGINLMVQRPFSVEIEYYDEKFQYQKEIFGGVKSRVLQHEIDHLDGKLFIDRLDIETRSSLIYSLIQIKHKKIKTLYPTK